MKISILSIQYIVNHDIILSKQEIIIQFETSPTDPYAKIPYLWVSLKTINLCFKNLKNLQVYT